MGERDPRRKRKWAEHELGELLGRAWGDEPALAGGPYEVERLPSEAEGGVVGLLLGGRAEPAEPGPAATQPAATHPAAAHNGPVDAGGTGGRARLNDMIDHLPTEAAVRMTPADVDLDDPALAPPVVWFWGDDDIYPGKVPGVAQPVSPKRARRRRSAPVRSSE